MGGLPGSPAPGERRDRDRLRKARLARWIAQTFLYVSPQHGVHACWTQHTQEPGTIGDANQVAVGAHHQAQYLLKGGVAIHSGTQLCRR